MEILWKNIIICSKTLKSNTKKCYIMRFDGKEMTKRFKPKDKLFDMFFIRSIKDTFFDFCNNHEQQILFGYQCNDEISILIKGTDQAEEDTDNRVEKLLSLFASEISVLFDRHYLQQISERINPKSLDSLNIFDARIFQVPKRMLHEYFILRQAFGIEHVTTRIQNIFKGHSRTKEVVFLAIKEQEQDADEIYYGNVYSPLAKLRPFEFKHDPERLKKSIFRKAF